MPFESDFLLPLGILRQLRATDRASGFVGHRPKSKPQPKPKKPQQVRLERAHPRGGKTQHPGTQMYNLIDDDGELLLNLRVHNEQQQLEELSLYDSPWLPSKWRPTTASSLLLGVTSSSPRLLPLHQYLRGSGSSGNRLEQDTAKRRRYDWPHK
ncbi:GL25255 [Drosophila persimilis]|uniref:GL25255 n=1 Tax=Drosophila persimilis TaxID=7234 RepID=B4GU46_DROPE|nr:GL25255 [Drosophila persimilis]